MKLKTIPTAAIIVVAMFVFFGALFAYLVYAGVVTIDLGTSHVKQMSSFDEATLVADLKSLDDVDPNFSSIRAYFVDLADAKGGVYAFEILKRAILPPNTDLHLMGHAVGDELYKQQGFTGMQYCTHDFRNACSHSIVVGALLEEGLAVFDRVNEVCKNAPGGAGAYTMCFHGFGHGVLAYTEYEIPDAIELCKKVGTPEFNNEEAYQCIGGMVMEMHQGVHDPEIWMQKKDKYLTEGDPLRICEEEYMPEEAKTFCYSYITPYIFDAAGAIAGNPTPDIYPASFAYCDAVENEMHRKTCYAGLGKEFIVLAQDRDIRRIEDTPDDKLQLAASWCMLAEKQEAQDACLLDILNSIFWGGENDPEVSVRYCALQEENMRGMCFNHLFNIASYYIRELAAREDICESVPDTYTESCRQMLAL